MAARSLRLAAAGLIVGAITGYWFDQLVVEAGLGAMAGMLLSFARSGAPPR